MKIALTGGGTAGHAMVNKVLLPLLDQTNWDTIYIGSYSGAEQKMITSQGIAKYYGISTGKLRRYLSWKNVTDVFRVMKGFCQAYKILTYENPHVIYSGGGFVSVPVILAAAFLQIPVIIRETDYSIGLANKIGMHFAKKVFVTFPDTLQQIQRTPCEYGGLIVRQQLLQNNQNSTQLRNKEKPIILVLGGSMGSEILNRAIWEAIPELLPYYEVLHLCGVGNIKENLQEYNGYQQFEYVDQMELLYAKADIVMTRCGSNALSEGLALGKRLICIPLSQKYSRGEQFHNAEYAVKHGNAVILKESILSHHTILTAAKKLMEMTINTESILKEQQLEENCQKQIKEMKRLSLQQLEKQFLNHLKYGNKIIWEELKDWELLIFEELSECYGADC